MSSQAPQFESINSSVLSLLYDPTFTFIDDYWKNHSFDYMDFVSTVMSLHFNTLSRFVITFLTRKRLLILWFHINFRIFVPFLWKKPLEF